MLFYTLVLDTEEEKTKLEQIYEKYHQAMFAIAYDILNDQLVTEDAVHSAVLKVIKCLDDLDLGQPDKLWNTVAKITRRTAIDLYRKRKREQKITSLDVLEDWRLPAELKDIFWELPEENRIIEAIKCMPPLYREVFIMKYQHHYENKEIAEMFGISEDSVRKRISRGKRKLGEILKERGVL